jgi:hypothetical protein
MNRPPPPQKTPSQSPTPAQAKLPSASRNEEQKPINIAGVMQYIEKMSKRKIAEAQHSPLGAVSPMDYELSTVLEGKIGANPSNKIRVSITADLKSISNPDSSPSYIVTIRDKANSGVASQFRLTRTGDLENIQINPDHQGLLGTSENHHLYRILSRAVEQMKKQSPL